MRKKGPLNKKLTGIIGIPILLATLLVGGVNLTYPHHGNYEGRKQQKRQIDEIVLHHTGGRLGSLDSPAFIRLRHKYLNGWDDVGYHFIVGSGNVFTSEGEVYQARPVGVKGAHTKEHNENSIGIALVGDYSHSAPSNKQLRSLKNKVVELCKKYDIHPKNIYGHGERTPGRTVCPGEGVNMEEFRRSVRLELNE